MPQTTLISFDIDQTLLDFRRTLFEALDAVGAMMSLALDRPINARALQEIRDQIAQTHRGQAVDMLSLRRLSFECALEGHRDADRLSGEAMRLFTEIRFGRVYFLPGALALLESLRGRVALAALTNGNSDPRRAGIGAHFDHVVLAQAYPFEKPDPRIFQVLFERAGIKEPQEVLHVGDQLRTDVLGANRAGAVSVWYNPDRLHNDTGICPDFEISALHQVTTLL